MTDPADHDLAPRPPRPGRSRARRWVPAIVGIAVLVTVVVLVVNLFTGALFFYHADEAVARRADLGDDRFTLQGTPLGCSIVRGTQDSEVVTAFTVVFNGVLIVVHRGDPAGCSRAGPQSCSTAPGSTQRPTSTSSPRWPTTGGTTPRIGYRSSTTRTTATARTTSGWPRAKPRRSKRRRTAACEQRPSGRSRIAVGAAAALTGVIVVGLGLAGRRRGWWREARGLVVVQAAAAVLAFVVMERALITRDFTVRFVAENGSSRTPAIFNFATLWSALEGSILLWTLILCGYVVAVVVKFRDRRDDPMLAWALLTLFVVCSFFFLLTVGPASPFRSFSPPAGYDGPGPNPLLQNHILMAFHPPVLYLGYVGFTVPFAFAIGALTTGRVGEGWLLATRRWTVMAWGFLTLGIVLGAWWSYETLGWGGYWAWDPVENASFLPWLTGTAFIHSVMVQERRGMLRVWNLSLVVATFALTILGTFITRSGVLQSVHAFSDSAIGPALLGFFAAIVVVALGLIAWRGDQLRAPGRIDSPISREGAFLANNVLFAAFAFVVLLGTTFPLVVEALDGRTISVGNPYFERMTMPIGFVLLFLMAIAPVLPWRKASSGVLADRLLWPAGIAVAVMLLSVVVGARGWAPLLAFGLGGFAGGSTSRQVVARHPTPGSRLRRSGPTTAIVPRAWCSSPWPSAGCAYVRQDSSSSRRAESATFAGHELTYVGSGLGASEPHGAAGAVRVDGGQALHARARLPVRAHVRRALGALDLATTSPLSVQRVPRGDERRRAAGHGAAADRVALGRRPDHGDRRSWP
ncbi:MAG: cytochrome c biogenesis protein CcsA [Acidimicrobiales bacterium]